MKRCQASKKENKILFISEPTTVKEQHSECTCAQSGIAAAHVVCSTQRLGGPHLVQMRFVQFNDLVVEGPPHSPCHPMARSEHVMDGPPRGIRPGGGCFFFICQNARGHPFSVSKGIRGHPFPETWEWRGICFRKMGIRLTKTLFLDCIKRYRYLFFN